LDPSQNKIVLIFRVPSHQNHKICEILRKKFLL